MRTGAVSVQRAQAPAPWEPGAAAAAVRAFFLSHEAVQVWESGRMVAQLAGERAGFSLSGEGERLVCHFWSAEANLVRRVVGWREGGDRLVLQCLRLGQSQATPLLLRAAAPGTDGERSGRAEFRQAVIAAAERDWRGWRYEPAGAGPGTGRSGVQRLLFHKQQAQLACVAVREEESSAVVASALTQALVWAEQARERWPRRTLAGVRLVLPAGGEKQVAWRRPCLRTRPVLECYQLDRPAGRLEPAGEDAAGNVACVLPRAPGAAAMSVAAAALMRDLREICPQATWETGTDGGGRARCYGLEVVREARGAEALAAPFYFGCGREQSPLLEATRGLYARFLREVAEQRVAGGERRWPFYSLQPERWMEHLLRHDLGCLDAQVDPRFVYAQVGGATAGERELLDLLAVDRQGRLLVVELKADEDLNFPLQALDYWRRVRQHQLNGDWERLGYFPGVALSGLPPRLWLVAPALRWHPHTDFLGRWISPEVPWTRWGLNEEWRHGIQVVYRKDAVHA